MEAEVAQEVDITKIEIIVVLEAIAQGETIRAVADTVSEEKEAIDREETIRVEVMANVETTMEIETGATDQGGIMMISKGSRVVIDLEEIVMTAVRVMEVIVPGEILIAIAMVIRKGGAQVIEMIMERIDDHEGLGPIQTNKSKIVYIRKARISLKYGPFYL